MAPRKRTVVNDDPSHSAGIIPTKKRSMLSTKLNSVPRRDAKRSILCPHCNSSVSSKTFRRHKSLYFDVSKDVWQTEERESERRQDLFPESMLVLSKLS